MRKSKYTESQIMAILKQNESGVSVQDLCREHGMSSAMFYQWRSKFGGMNVSMMKRLKELELENTRLKKVNLEQKLNTDRDERPYVSTHILIHRTPIRPHRSSSSFSLLDDSKQLYLEYQQHIRADILWHAASSIGQIGGYKNLVFASRFHLRENFDPSLDNFIYCKG